MTDPALEEIERLYREDGARLERALVLYAGDREIAREALSEAFAQAIHGRSHIRDSSAWIWHVAFRIAAAELRDRGRRKALDAEPAYLMPEPVVDLVRGLQRLTPKQRSSVVLFHYAGYTSKEVAKIIGSTPAAVSVHLAVGRKRLREFLEADDDGS